MLLLLLIIHGCIRIVIIACIHILVIAIVLDVHAPICLLHHLVISIVHMVTRIAGIDHDHVLVMHLLIVAVHAHHINVSVMEILGMLERFGLREEAILFFKQLLLGHAVVVGLCVEFAKLFALRLVRLRQLLNDERLFPLLRHRGEVFTFELCCTRRLLQDLLDVCVHFKVLYRKLSV